MVNKENLIFLLGPTNTGKTHYAIERMLAYNTGIIGLPLRLLAREVYDKVSKKVGKLKVALITGEEQIKPVTAKYFITTVEAMPEEKFFDFAAVDEIQLCTDLERGHVFTNRLLNLRGELETLFLGSDLMEKVLKSIFPQAIFLKKKRRSKLSFIGKKGLLGLPKRSAIIAFNSNDVYSIASRIKNMKGGAAIVMGSLSPLTRNSQVSMFEEGTVDYIVATDAIGMGLNLDVNNVSFSSLNKFDGKENRFLKNNEIGQIAGRAGRNFANGTFSTTLNCYNLTSSSIKAIENHNYDSAEFLYWRQGNLDFSSLYDLLKSLEKKSSDSRLIKTQNKRDENTLKYLSGISAVKVRLNNKENMKLLWDISTIPDYFKNLDSVFSDLLIKIFCSIVDEGVLDTSWAILETKKLQNLEGSIDMLTFRLAKTRFWNYISNRSQWTNNNLNLRELALETEKLLSDALHERLTNEFVDKKLKVFLKEFNISKSLDIRIKNNEFLLLNNTVIGEISGLQVKIYDEKSLFKNKFLKTEISVKAKLLIEDYAKSIIYDPELKISTNNNSELFCNNKKIASIYKGESLLSPNLIINNNKYLSHATYIKLLKRINHEIKIKIRSVFWQQDYNPKVESSAIKSILFYLNQGLGIFKYSEYENNHLNLNKKEKNQLEKKGIIFGQKYIYYSSIISDENREFRWLLGNIYFKGKSTKEAPKNRIIYNAVELSEKALCLSGYVKINNIAIKIDYLESVFNKIYRKNRKIFYFDYVILNELNLSPSILFNILNFLGFLKIVGTSYVSYWILNKRNNKLEKKYDENSPFYILKKLQ